MISPYIPWPLHGGTSVRIFNIIKELHKKDYKIILLAGNEHDTILKDTPLNEICEEIYYYKILPGNSLGFIVKSLLSFQPYPLLKFKTNLLQKKISHLVNNKKFDLIWINLSILADVLPKDLPKDMPIILDHPECEELFYKDYINNGNLFEKFFGILNLIKFKKFHKRIFSKINTIFCVSQEEVNFTKNQVRNKSEVYFVPNGVDNSFFMATDGVRDRLNNIMFCSSMSVRRNIDAASWFAKSIFPEVKKKVTNAEFWIVGSDPTPEVFKLALIPGVKVVGTVEDIRPYYLQGKVFVSPYHFGAGTKLKIFEAMASGIPIVSTTIGCRGIDLVSGKNILIADNKEDFIRDVISLLTNDNLATTLSKNASHLARNNYSWEKIVGNIESKISLLINR